MIREIQRQELIIILILLILAIVVFSIIMYKTNKTTKINICELKTKGTGFFEIKGFVSNIKYNKTNTYFEISDLNCSVKAKLKQKPNEFFENKTIDAYCYYDKNICNIKQIIQ